MKGELDSQNSWVASPAAGALVQTNWVQGGDQALLTGFNFLTTDIHQLFTVTNAPTVWMDMYQLVYGGNSTYKRSSWCDRILFFPNPGNSISLTEVKMLGRRFLITGWLEHQTGFGFSVEMGLFKSSLFPLFRRNLHWLLTRPLQNYRSGFSVLAFEGGLGPF